MPSPVETENAKVRQLVGENRPSGHYSLLLTTATAAGAYYYYYYHHHYYNNYYYLYLLLVAFCLSRVLSSQEMRNQLSWVPPLHMGGLIKSLH